MSYSFLSFLSIVFHEMCYYFDPLNITIFLFFFNNTKLKKKLLKYKY